MQSRRHEDFAPQSSSVRAHQNINFDRDSYLMMPAHSKRSLSPSRMEGSSYSKPPFDGHRGRVLEDGSRRIRSRSPPFMEAKRGGPMYDDGCVIDKGFPPTELHRRYEFFDSLDMNRGDDPRVRNEVGYRHDKAVEKKFDGGMRDVVNMKSSVMEDSAGLGAYRSAEDARAMPGYDERGMNFSSKSVSMGMGQTRNERVPHAEFPDSFSLDKYTAREQFEEDEKNTIRRKGAPYSGLMIPRSNEFMGALHFKDYASNSPGNSRVDHLAYRGGMPLPRDDRPRSSADIPEPLFNTRYRQRQHLDINDDLARYQWEIFSPPRTDYCDSLRHQPRIREGDEPLYSSDDIYRKMNLRERVDIERVDIGCRDTMTPIMRDSVAQRTKSTEFALGKLSNNSSWDHPSVDKLRGANNIGLSRSPAEKRESGRYLNSASVHSRLGRKIASEQEMPHLGMLQDCDSVRTRDEYDFKRVSPGSHEERLRSSPRFLYDSQRLQLAERTQNMEGHDHVRCGSSSRIPKRKYTVNEEENRMAFRTHVSRSSIVSRRHDKFDRDDEWIDHDARDSVFTKRRGYAHGFRKMVDKTYDDEDPTSEDWFPFHDPEEQMHYYSTKSYEYGSTYAKGYSRSGAPSGHNSYHPNRRHVPRWKTTWIRGEDEHEVDMYSGEIKQSDGWVSSAKPEPPEGSEEFKQLIHDYFLSFIKKLNDTPGVRRRYMEQGRAGSLFCTVCGRSLSKEFLDTQRLATHAFMSHKVGLRAQHLGLHKAICVLLGWSNAVPPETVTWYPETLSIDQALAQKEDLILWPPVVIIHNISISNNNSYAQGPTTVDALGEFLRGKGLSSGRVKLGKPANGSIMLVKFLGTFSGLQDAEKIHKYFAEKNHGRKDFEQVSFSKGKSISNCGDGEKTKGDELVLFGYMGIVQDLDKVDFDTKRKCSIKSKKDIQDLVDAPVKPE